MKKLWLINTFVTAFFFVTDPLLVLCVKMENSVPLGVQVFIGAVTPILFVLLILTSLCSIGYSVFKTFKNKNIKYLMPISVLLVGAISYIKISMISDSFGYWVVVALYLYFGP